MAHTKICSKCGKKYPATAEHFHRSKKEKSGFSCWCKKCAAAYRKVYDKTDKAKKTRQKYRQSLKGKETVQKGKLRFRHGPGAVELWNTFFVEQNGICPGCGKHQSELNTKLALDHDHKSGIYRGLLCKVCNLKAGSSEEDLQILKNLVKYLENFYGSYSV